MFFVFDTHKRIGGTRRAFFIDFSASAIVFEKTVIIRRGVSYPNGDAKPTVAIGHGGDVFHDLRRRDLVNAVTTLVTDRIRRNGAHEYCTFAFPRRRHGSAMISFAIGIGDLTLQRLCPRHETECAWSWRRRRMLTNEQCRRTRACWRVQGCTRVNYLYNAVDIFRCSPQCS